MKNKDEKFYDPFLKGIGQIMLQENSLTGLLFLIGILINSPLLALGTLVGAVVGTLTAKLFKYDKGNISSGLYGFNAALVGIAMLVFFEGSILVWIGIILLAALSTLVMNFFLNKKIPVFTFPFIALVWIALYFFHEVVPVDPPAEGDLAGLIEETVVFELSNFGFGFGEVIFQGSLLSGLIFMIAVYINNPIAAIYGLVGAFFAALFAVLTIDQFDALQQGWFTFNAVLCAIVFSGLEKKDGLFVLIAVFFSVLIENFMMSRGLIFLTFPFVAGTWITLWIKHLLVKNQNNKIKTKIDPVSI
ncbi:urea transporter [Pararhodonellum marinum]|uniref:urea transporter n=1 Tax=Pararhodonellum marinum TaxID=2755358 RepID=UPI00188E08DD|nr:urea transporter [Pararhodonellum marinum]